MNSDPFDDAFGDLDKFYPGSRRLRRAVEPSAAMRAVSGDNSWDSSPVIKVLPNGRQVEMFSIGAMCAALGRPEVTLRHWERQGYIPKAPYRFREAVLNGKRVPGRRLYTRAMIEAAIMAFERHQVISSKRINWANHATLTAELLEAWTTIHESDMSPL